MRKILAIDGGGIKGVFAAAFLAELEDHVEGKIGEYFDLITGTSTGGIIAIGLAMGMSARELTTLYEREGARIFHGNQWLRSARRALRTKYDSAGLRSVLEEKLGDRKLCEASTRLLIPSQVLESGEVYIYKTPHHTDFHTDWRECAVEVALATSAAPTFFPAARAERGPELLDGGLWANNPVALGCVEAVGHRLRWPLDAIKVLSISCTSSPMRRSFFRARGLTGALGWGTPLMEMMFVGQSRCALGLAQNLLGSENVCRVDPTVTRGQYKLDDVRGIDSLIGLGKFEARHRSKEIIEAFLGARAELFVPCYTARG